jgi:2,3-bisphosphoglycerate-dependent phosphoglycerate mutase
LLIEHDNGIIAGMLKSELNEKYPLPAFDSPFSYYPENSGENDVQEHARAGLALSRLIDFGPGRYLIVTHGGIGNAILRNIFGISYMVNGSGVSFRLKDNGWIQVNYYEDKDHWQLLRME